MTHHPLALALSLGALVVVVGCEQLTEPPPKQNEVGFVVLNARAKAGGGYTTSPVANFYNIDQVQLSSAATAWDSCRVVPYDPAANSGMVVGPPTSVIGAGAFILASVSGRTDSLRPPSPLGDGSYRLGSAAGMTFTPGDTVKLTIAGTTNGFPASSVSGKTAEPFAFDPIETPSAGQGLPLAWTPATDRNAAMIVSFAYSSTAANTLNEQVYCAYPDDGIAFVPAAPLLKYIASPVKKLTAQRLRTAIVSVPATGVGAVLNLMSTFDWPTPVSP